jgi:hypothetical protein
VLLPIEIFKGFPANPLPAERSRSERSEDLKCPEGTRSPHVWNTWGCEAQDTGGRWTVRRAGQIRVISCCEATSGTPKADTCLSLIRPPRRAEAKRGGEDERSEDGGVNFCRSESQSSVQEVGVS